MPRAQLRVGSAGVGKIRLAFGVLACQRAFKDALHARPVVQRVHPGLSSSIQPQFRGRPVTLHGRRRNAEGFGGFLDRQADEESELDDPALLWIDGREAFERVVQRDDVNRALRGDHMFVKGGHGKAGAALVSRPLTRVIHQDAAHQRSGHREKVGAIPPLQAVNPGQPQIQLVDQRRRLQRVAVALAAHVVVGEPAQLFVDDRHESISCGRIAVGPIGKHLGYTLALGGVGAGRPSVFASRAILAPVREPWALARAPIGLGALIIWRRPATSPTRTERR